MDRSSQWMAVPTAMEDAKRVENWGLPVQAGEARRAEPIGTPCPPGARRGHNAV